jgi:gamma-glutamyl phosphate reductase
MNNNKFITFAEAKAEEEFYKQLEKAVWAKINIKIKTEKEKLKIKLKMEEQLQTQETTHTQTPAIDMSYSLGYKLEYLQKEIAERFKQMGEYETYFKDLFISMGLDLKSEKVEDLLNVRNALILLGEYPYKLTSNGGIFKSDSINFLCKSLTRTNQMIREANKKGLEAATRNTKLIKGLREFKKLLIKEGYFTK